MEQLVACSFLVTCIFGSCKMATTLNSVTVNTREHLFNGFIITEVVETCFFCFNPVMVSEELKGLLSATRSIV